MHATQRKWGSIRNSANMPAAILGIYLCLPILIQLGILGYVGALAFQFLTSSVVNAE